MLSSLKEIHENATYCEMLSRQSGAFVPFPRDFGETQ
jgi:hypothetical protein